MRPRRLAALALLLTLLAAPLVTGPTALAHPTVVFGELRSEPQTPQPGESFALTLTLREPSGLGVADAYVFAEFFRPGEAALDGQGLRADFTETQEGVYRAEASLPEAGTWTLKLRDQTYRQEETNARLEFTVAAEADSGAPPENPPRLEFVFPPTQTPAESVFTWLMWLIGLPLLVALVVTAVVLTSGKPQEPA